MLPVSPFEQSVHARKYTSSWKKRFAGKDSDSLRSYAATIDEPMARIVGYIDAETAKQGWTGILENSSLWLSLGVFCSVSLEEPWLSTRVLVQPGGPFSFVVLFSPCPILQRKDCVSFSVALRCLQALPTLFLETSIDWHFHVCCWFPVLPVGSRNRMVRGLFL